MPWDALLLSEVLYILIPIVLAQVICRYLSAIGAQKVLNNLSAKTGPASLVALLATFVLLLVSQGEPITKQPLVIAMLPVPILIQVRRIQALPMCSIVFLESNIVWPGHPALTGDSNFFGMAVATAISLTLFQEEPLRRSWAS